jgi:hypothetical protein
MATVFDLPLELLTLAFYKTDMRLTCKSMASGLHIKDDTPVVELKKSILLATRRFEG